MWKPDFNPSTATIGKIAAWIRLPGLAIEYYHRAILEKIGNIMGRTLKVDTNTVEVTRGKFVRLYVKVDLTQPLVSQYMINGVCYIIEYEGLHQVCFKCGRVGHEKGVCSEKKTQASATPENREDGRRAHMEGAKADEGGNPGNLAKGKDILGKDGDGDMYGPWMIVQRPLRGRRTEKVGEGTVSGTTSKGKDKEMTNIGNQSRFAVLQDLNPDSISIQNHNDIASKVNEKKDKEVENTPVHQKRTYQATQSKQSNRQTTQPNNNKPTQNTQKNLSTNPVNPQMGHTQSRSTIQNQKAHTLANIMQSIPDPAQSSHVTTAQITHTTNYRNNTPNHQPLAHHQENWANPEHSLSPTSQNDLFMCEAVENTLPLLEPDPP
ncbi:uncharacterized protein LOC130933521 [Arachis stenosperma]|uniref:uncharacterized protein LOC130933521 n=1 Tax=Arachis stenosperma TaxID=217475 RepID=UPI0025ABCF37|nr:uncharacterized protein LOC130933521 [Arachis stenosperma]